MNAPIIQQHCYIIVVRIFMPAHELNAPIITREREKMFINCIGSEAKRIGCRKITDTFSSSTPSCFCSLKMDKTPEFYQNVVVMRHAERIDKFEPSWLSSATRPWDPPLIQHGRERAFNTGCHFRHNLHFPLHRLFVSPFLRCIQTAFEVITAFSATTDVPNSLTSDGIDIDPSRLKVSVEYGLCEMMNRQAIKLEVVPKDGNWGFDDISVSEAMLPAGTVDNNVERIYKKLPEWEKPVSHAWARYEQIVKDLADNYPAENLLLITHGEGVRAALSSFKNGATASKIDYGAYLELRRPVFKKGESFTTGEFEVLTQSGQCGISYYMPSPLINGIKHTS